MIVTKHKHLLKAEAEYGHLVALCGKTVSSRAIAGEGQATCANCRRQLATQPESNVSVIRGCV